MSSRFGKASLVVLLGLALGLAPAHGFMSVDDTSEGVPFTLVELNCENLFDCKDDSLHNDNEWLPDAIRRWTHKRYWQKLNNIGQEIIACGETEGGAWALPDLVALCEVENDSVLFDLSRRSLLRKAGYDYVMTCSPDERGIDVAAIHLPFAPSSRPAHTAHGRAPCHARRTLCCRPNSFGRHPARVCRACAEPLWWRACITTLPNACG